MKNLIFALTALILFSCTQTESPVKGVSLELAQKRKELIDSLHYRLNFDIPVNKTEEINGFMDLNFYLNSKTKQIILDFKEDKDHVISVSKDNESIEWEFENDHIILNGRNFKKGWNSIQISFMAGNLSLNRQDEFMYTLFVPDRARTAFPCFDRDIA